MAQMKDQFTGFNDLCDALSGALDEVAEARATLNGALDAYEASLMDAYAEAAGFVGRDVTVQAENILRKEGQ